MIQMDQLQWALHCSDGEIFSREKGIWLFVKESNTGQGKSDLIASKNCVWKMTKLCPFRTGGQAGLPSFDLEECFDFVSSFFSFQKGLSCVAVTFTDYEN